ncbi:MAG: hypothetical protein CM15mP18_2940 [Methanobacteriota archaeon]|nr:MAG: hypothetical protein CM15mP18_2940 [Euryarchaeota archaeon]
MALLGPSMGPLCFQRATPAEPPNGWATFHQHRAGLGFIAGARGALLSAPSDDSTRVPVRGKGAPFSGTTIRWAACGVMHRATKPFLIHVCPSIFANTYYRLAGVKLGQIPT